MRWTFILLLSLAACASEAPQPEPAPASPPSPAKAAPHKEPPLAVGVEDVPHSDDPKVLASFPRARQRMLLEAGRLELVGLICERDPDPGETVLQDEFVVRSRVVLETPAVRAKVLGALYKGLASSGGAIAMCFEPHHAILAEVGDQRWEILICYACNRIQVYQGENSLGGGGIESPGSEVLNEVLGQDGNIPSGEERGRPISHWVKLFRAGLGGAEAGDDFQNASETLEHLLTEGSLSSALLRDVLECQVARFAQDVIETCSTLGSAVEDSKHAPTRRGVIDLIARLAQVKPKNGPDAEALSDLGTKLLEVIRQPLPKPPAKPEPNTIAFEEEPAPATSPAMRKAAARALAALTWADAEMIEGWQEDAKQEEDSTVRARMLAALAPLSKAK